MYTKTRKKENPGNWRSHVGNRKHYKASFLIVISIVHICIEPYHPNIGLGQRPKSLPQNFAVVHMENRNPYSEIN